ncbi:hypothetical protein NP493_2g17003 [Ridgeia piscesae]|uniref:Uncharacterized protein n=1 Tax=Ridgeia piscesae TaxID=27915 RepID=A0AAD9PGB4_RIDPI|nr:hypothetical protein NP493_2g17003 [Ridgeia piscesae]
MKELLGCQQTSSDPSFASPRQSSV